MQNCQNKLGVLYLLLSKPPLHIAFLLLCCCVYKLFPKHTIFTNFLLVERGILGLLEQAKNQGIDINIDNNYSPCENSNELFIPR